MNIKRNANISSSSRHCEALKTPRQFGFLKFISFLILIIFTLILTGCHHHSGSVVVPEEEAPTLNIRGTVNLNNIKFPTSLCGNNSYQFIDLSVFNLSIQDDTQNTAYVSSNGEFSFSEMLLSKRIEICSHANKHTLSSKAVLYI